MPSDIGVSSPAVYSLSLYAVSSPTAIISTRILLEPEGRSGKEGDDDDFATSMGGGFRPQARCF